MVRSLDSCSNGAQQICYLCFPGFKNQEVDESGNQDPDKVLQLPGLKFVSREPWVQQWMEHCEEQLSSCKEP